MALRTTLEFSQESTWVASKKIFLVKVWLIVYVYCGRGLTGKKFFKKRNITSGKCLQKPKKTSVSL